MQKIRDWKCLSLNGTYMLNTLFPRLGDHCRTGSKRSKGQRHGMTPRKQCLQDTPAHMNSQWLWRYVQDMSKPKLEQIPVLRGELVMPSFWGTSPGGPWCISNSLKLMAIVSCWEREREFSLGVFYPWQVDHTPMVGHISKNIWEAQVGLDRCLQKGHKFG